MSFGYHTEGTAVVKLTSEPASCKFIRWLLLYCWCVWASSNLLWPPRLILHWLLFLLCPVINSGNQVRIYNKSFIISDFIGTILANKSEINDHFAWNKRELMKLIKCNQMMHSYKFCTFYGDQSLNTGWNT